VFNGHGRGATGLFIVELFIVQRAALLLGYADARGASREIARF
jgi:hypothetical protein